MKIGYAMFQAKFLTAKPLLIFICVLFLFTRLYKISEIPQSVYWDEASIGYNAFSIAETGKDEWGKTFPIHFRAFGEFKLPVYIYSVVPFVKLFGLNAFSVRFPAVLFSLGVVILTYLLSKKLFDNELISLMSSFFVSISPWFFIFSRTGYEATAGLMFYLLAVYLFLKIKKNIWYIFFSILGFIFSAYSYNSFRIIIPFTIFILGFYFINILKNNSTKAIIPVVLSIIIIILSIIPIYRLYKFDAGTSRLQAVSTTSTAFINNYLSHFSLNFLFLNGDKNLRSQLSNSGQLYFLDLLFLPLGLFYIFKYKIKNGFLILILLLLGPIPAAITKESPHALRSISLVPFISMISALGIFFIHEVIKKRYAVGLVVIISLGFFINYYLNFLIIFPNQSSEDWQYGYKKIYTNYKNEFSKYNQIIISDEYAQPYIFALFYLQYDLNKFRQEAVLGSVNNWGFSTVTQFDKFEFGKVDNLLSSAPNNSLIFATNEENNKNLVLLETINFLDGKTALWVYKK